MIQLCYLASQCQPNGVLFDNMCYYPSEDEANSFADAQRRCRKQFHSTDSTLVVIDSQRVNDFLSDLLRSRNGNDIIASSTTGYLIQQYNNNSYCVFVDDLGTSYCPL